MQSSADPCTGAHRRYFLLGVRRGQPTEAHVQMRCFKQVRGWYSRWVGPLGQPTINTDRAISGVQVRGHVARTAKAPVIAPGAAWLQPQLMLSVREAPATRLPGWRSDLGCHRDLAKLHPDRE
jgi:hypothetical protein